MVVIGQVIEVILLASPSILRKKSDVFSPHLSFDPEGQYRGSARHHIEREDRGQEAQSVGNAVDVAAPWHGSQLDIKDQKFGASKS